jgi:hypothetical protein
MKIGNLTITKMPDVKISKEKKPELTRMDRVANIGSSSQSGFAGSSSKETGFAQYIPDAIEINFWKVIKGDILPTLSTSGVRKKSTKPEISLSILQNYKTEASLPEGFGEVQNVITGQSRLFVHYAGTDGSPIMGDLIINSIIILSGGISEITITDNGNKCNLPIGVVLI